MFILCKSLFSLSFSQHNNDSSLYRFSIVLSSSYSIYSYLINSNISGFSCSRCFIRSRIAVIIEFALSSAPCLELFSAAPKMVHQFRFVCVSCAVGNDGNDDNDENETATEKKREKGNVVKIKPMYIEHSQ